MKIRDTPVYWAHFRKWTNLPAEFVRHVMVTAVVVVYSRDDLIHNTYAYVSDASAK